MDIMSYLLPTLIPLVVALVIIGKVLKDNKSVPDKYIPIILTVISIIAAFVILVVAGDESILTACIQGVLAAGVAVYGNQVVKQLNKPE